jgi:hypothetical protein
VRACLSVCDVATSKMKLPGPDLGYFPTEKDTYICKIGNYFNVNLLCSVKIYDRWAKYICIFRFYWTK